MNKSRIEWCDHSWNPITGCNHSCEYCYAKGITRRFSGDVRLNMSDDRCRQEDGIYVLDEPFATDRGIINYPFDFAPTLHNYKFDWPGKIKNGANIFVGSMTDLFGDWVPDEIINRVFEACEKYPQHNYIFLTKNPKRYLELEEKGFLRTGDNFWYGSSTPTPETKFFYYNKLKTFISIEPLLEPFGCEEDIENTDWIIIGAETGKRKDKVKPKADWITNIVRTADIAKVPVFMKDSLIPIMGEENMRRDFPSDLCTKALSPKLKEKLYQHCGYCQETFKKSDMYAILSREKRGASTKSVGYICKECYDTFTKGFNEN